MDFARKMESMQELQTGPPFLGADHPAPSELFRVDALVELGATHRDYGVLRAASAHHHPRLHRRWMIPLRGGRGAESRLGTCASRELAPCVGCLDKTSAIDFYAQSLGAWLGGRVLPLISCVFTA